MNASCHDNGEIPPIKAALLQHSKDIGAGEGLVSRGLAGAPGNLS